ncbi:Hsp33 family molecular chaperone HslO [Fusobacterium sp. IOR10]|uniref:Hsp33 family molecular chaperone HslO n=1 Tax=Fusobacterium sp. IOR10 TaxID=2665157 RepID=UPI0013D19F9F|nr:Hsp33 family molecular chaperone HslO [Fusobacterium sp. IOR10]
MIRGTSKNARFFIVDSTKIVQEALDIHKCSPTGINAFGRFLTAGLIMGGTLKGDDLLSIITDTDGLVNQMVVTANGKGEVKGYLNNPTADLPCKQLSNKADVANLIGKGTLRVIKDMGLKEPYSGLSEILSGEIAEDIAYYYVTSEQIPTVIALGVELSDEKTVKVAGGYMVQLFPDADEKFIDLLEKKIKAMRNVTELLKGGMDLERIAKLIYEDMDDENYEKLIEPYEILESKEVKYFCNCNKEKYYKGLIALGKEELEKVLTETNGKVETECHFCGKKYEFSREDLKEFLNN